MLEMGQINNMAMPYYQNANVFSVAMKNPFDFGSGMCRDDSTSTTRRQFIAWLLRTTLQQPAVCEIMVGFHL